jgi:hypothetical protein
MTEDAGGKRARQMLDRVPRSRPPVHRLVAVDRNNTLAEAPPASQGLAMQPA